MTHAHSDSEADFNGHFYSHVNQMPSVPEDRGHYERVNGLDGDHDEEEDGDLTRGRSYSLDEFGENQDSASRLVRTGRQRKKLAARSKGGEFRAKRKKRRVYFCCASSEIDVQKLFDYLVGAGSLLNGWKYQLHADVLHLFKPGFEDRNPPIQLVPTLQEWTAGNKNNLLSSVDGDDMLGDKRTVVDSEIEMHRRNSDVAHNVRFADSLGASTANPNEPQWSDSSRISGIGAQEVFVFDFGAAVFWVLISTILLLFCVCRFYFLLFIVILHP